MAYTDSGSSFIALIYIICILGILGNLIAILIILVLKDHQKSVTHWYILQLAIADTIFLATLPFSIAQFTQNAWPLPDWMCPGRETVKYLNFYASTFFLMVMSFDRYIAVCHPFSAKLQKFRKPFSVMIITIVAWIVALLCCIPVMLTAHVGGMEPYCTCQYDFSVLSLNYTCEEGKCYERRCLTVEAYSASGSYGNSGDENDEKSTSTSGMGTPIAVPYTVPPHLIDPSCALHKHQDHSGFLFFDMFNFIGMFLLPIIVMTVCYGLIIHRLSATRVKSARLASTSSEVSIKKRKSTSSSSDYRRRRVTVMCATLVSSFVFSWLPFHAYQIAQRTGIFGTRSDFCEDIKVTGSILAFLSSAMNPFLYSFLGTNFRRRLRTATETVQNVLRRRHSSTSVFMSARTQLRRRERISSTNSHTKTGVTKLMRSFSAKPSQSQDPYGNMEQINQHTAFENEPPQSP